MLKITMLFVVAFVIYGFISKKYSTSQNIAILQNDKEPMYCKKCVNSILI